MKTFRLFRMTLLMVLCAVNFTACSDDNEEQQKDETLTLLIGKWEDEPFTFTDLDGNVVELITEILTFNTDMTWTGVDYHTGTNYPNGMTEKWGEGTYSYDKGKNLLIMVNNISHETESAVLLKLTQSELSFIGSDNTMNYTRKQ
ncbi:hypothetical protein [Bacteroides sp.]